MSTAMAVTLTFLLYAGYLMWSGSLEISTRTITTRHRHRHSWVVREYTLTHSLVPYIGWLKLAWSVPILIMGFQALLNIHPTLIDVVMPHFKTLLKTTDKHVSESLLFISLGLFIIPNLLAMMFGESERVR
jgi:hypothetical protein